MFFVNSIPHLKLFKQRTYLPVDLKVTSMYSIVFLNSKTIDSSLNMIDNNFIFNNNKFHHIFLEPTFKGKLGSKNYMIVYRREREAIYSTIEKKKSFLNTVVNLDSLKERNLYYDMSKNNNIFFTYTGNLNYEKKIQAYINYLISIYNDARFSNYKIKTMMINIDEWVTGVKNSLNNKPDFTNPIFIIYFAMYRYFDEFKNLGNIDLIFYNSNSVLRLNPSLCDKDSYKIFKREFSKINTMLNTSDNEEDIDKEIKKVDIVNSISSSFKERYNFVGDNEESSKFDANLKDKIEVIYDDIKTNDEKISDKDASARVDTKLIAEPEIMKQLYQISQEEKTGKSSVSLKRDQMLRDKQKELKINNMPIEEFENQILTNYKIEENDVQDKVFTLNKNITKIKYSNIDKGYNEKLFKSDLIKIITSLNNKSIPVYVRNINVDDSSDELNFKETYTVDLEDANRVRHTLKFDIPKFIDDKFMYLGGNKKIIIKQWTMKPIVKIGPDEIRISGNYKIIFMNRYGTKVSSKLEKLKKALLSNKTSLKIKLGNNTTDNLEFRTTIDYDELAREYTYIKSGNTEFYFNQKELKKVLEDNKIAVKPSETDLCVGITDKKNPIFMDLETQQIGGEDLVDFILKISGDKLNISYDDSSVGKKFMYTRVTILKKNVPLVLLLGYLEGLSTILRKAGIKHYFSDTRPKYLPEDQGIVPFADGYLVYDKYPFENSLLMNAFADIPTKAFNYEEFDSKDAYLSIFDVMFGSKIIGNGFDNFYEVFIDPITEKVLNDLNYPTDFVGLLLFASALLTDNAHLNERDMNIYNRIRSNEIVNAILYNEIATAYTQYRITANNNNPVKISIPQDIIIKKLLTMQNIEDYSKLNPIVELEKSRAVTPKGHAGLNVADAYTQDKRSYDKTMLGIAAMSTSPDANCGVVRQLTLEPNIVNPRGYLNLNGDNLDKLNDANLFSPAELLSPLGATRDDSSRTAMATKQSKHIVPIKKASPVLISNGVEQVIQYHLSSDFVIVAKDDGIVSEVDDKLGLIMVTYKDGSSQAIDTSSRVVKNGAGGFYLSNQLNCELKKGDKFKKNDILASDKSFFSNSKLAGNRFNIGSFQKVACMSKYSTFEDSTFVTKKLSNDMASEMVMHKTVALGKNANVDYVVKIGDEIQVGDELIRFESSIEGDDLNKFLSSIGSELQEEIKSLGKSQVKSKYSGVIENIKVYSTVELDDMSPSLRKLVSEYYSKIEKRKKLINKYDSSDSIYKCGMLLNEPTKKIETKDGKIKGTDVGDGVLIEFFIKFHDSVGVGDKLTFFTALKSIVGEVVEEGQEPYSEFRPNEEISSVIAPSAVLARMTPSILLTMFGNKVLVELKRNLQEIYEGKPWEPKKE